MSLVWVAGSERAGEQVGKRQVAGGAGQPGATKCLWILGAESARGGTPHGPDLIIA
jgi:hypothetical protein